MDEEEGSPVSELEAIFISMVDGLLLIGPDGTIRRANPEAQAFVGGNVQGMDRAEFVRNVRLRHLDGRPVEPAEIPSRRVLAGQTVRNERYLGTDAQGRTVTILASGSPLRSQGKITGAVMVARDVSEQQRLADQVQHQAAELDAIVSASAEGLLLFDRSGTLLRMNQAAEKFLDQIAPPTGTLRERTDQLQFETAAGRPYPREELPSARALRGETTRGLVLSVQAADRRKWFSCSGAPVRSPTGELLGAVVNITDVTSLHELQQQQEDFLEALTHDIRIPLSIILTQAELIRRRPMDPEENLLRRVDSVTTSVRRISAMIDELLEMIALDSGKLDMTLDRLDLPAFLFDLKERLGGTLETRRLRVDAPQELPPVRADPSRIERILVNLLSNAFKYSPPDSEVLLRCWRQESHVAISVTDHGDGISSQDLPRIFERFYRARNRRRAGGLGLGLYIARKLVEAHGGTISVESQPGLGSTFRIILPASPLHEAGSPVGP